MGSFVLSRAVGWYLGSLISTGFYFYSFFFWVVTVSLEISFNSLKLDLFLSRSLCTLYARSFSLSSLFGVSCTGCPSWDTELPFSALCSVLIGLGVCHLFPIICLWLPSLFMPEMWHFLYSYHPRACYWPRAPWEGLLRWRSLGVSGRADVAGGLEPKKTQ